MKHNSQKESPRPQSGEPSPDPNSESILTEDELKKLIPERFTTKYSLSIQLVEIEKNKPGNPILKMNVKVKGLPRYRQSIYKDVRRTFNEVVKFNRYLIVSNLEVFVPVIPSAITSYPTGGEDERKKLLSNGKNGWIELLAIPF